MIGESTPSNLGFRPTTNLNSTCPSLRPLRWALRVVRRFWRGIQGEISGDFRWFKGVNLLCFKELSKGALLGLSEGELGFQVGFNGIYRGFR